MTARIVDLVLSRHAAKVAIPSGRSAYMELMRVRKNYDEDKATGANVARDSCADGVSLPETVAGAPFWDAVLPSFMQMFLEDAMQRMIRTEQEFKGVEFVVPTGTSSSRPAVGRGLDSSRP